MILQNRHEPRETSRADRQGQPDTLAITGEELMHRDVAIIGGGLSGLSLAYQLEREGVDYVLLEARDRLGGRILSESSNKNLTSDERYDLGPAWIWPGQPRIASLIREFGLTVFEQYSKGKLVYQEADGSVRRDFNFSTMAGSLRIAGGVASLIDALWTRIDEKRILLSHAVTHVSQNKDGFTIAANGPKEELSINARCVVHAVPPSIVARTISFDPPLSRDVLNTLEATPTWMAGQAKLVAIYEEPFWREMGLSGDGISRSGPLMEIHDASPHGAKAGALFGFVNVPSGSQARERSTLINNAIPQLEAMFGAQASDPVDVLFKDWANDRLTASNDDEASLQHALYGRPNVLAQLANEGLMFSSAEIGTQFGGLLEGALEAAEGTMLLISQSINGVKPHFRGE